MRNIFLATVAVIALLSVGAFAGDYHRTTTLICADCHVMHASQTHGYGVDGAGAWTPISSSTGNPRLLRQATVNALCLQCHDGNYTGAPDVFKASAIGPRGAGGLNSVGSTDPWAEDYGHTLGSHDVAPGGTFSDADQGLNCVDCHGAHGSSGWRNLGPYAPSGSPSMPKLTYVKDGPRNDSVDVWERVSHNYGQDNCDFPINQLYPKESQYANMCKFCHTNFHSNETGTGSANFDGSDFLKHPTSEVSINDSLGFFTNTALYRVKVMLPPGEDWGTQGSVFGAQRHITPSCFSCHKGHGNNNPFGLFYMLGSSTTVPGENGNGTMMRNTCNQCHGMGR